MADLRELKDSELRRMGAICAAQIYDGRLRYAFRVLVVETLRLREELARIAWERDTLKGTLGEALRARGYSVTDGSSEQALIVDVMRALDRARAGARLDGTSKALQATFGHYMQELALLAHAMEDVQLHVPADVHAELSCARVALQTAVESLSVASKCLDLPADGPYR